MHSGKALSVDSERTDNGAALLQWTWASGQHQEWKLVQKDEGFFALEARHSAKVLSVLAENPEWGAKLVQWTDENKPHQQFRLG